MQVEHSQSAAAMAAEASFLAQEIVNADMTENTESPVADAMAELYEQIDALMIDGKYAQALSVMLPHVREDNLDIGLLERTADCFFQTGDMDNALQVITYVTDNWPSEASAWGKQGLMLQSMGDIDGARIALEKVLALDPNSIPALCALNGIETFNIKSAHTQRLEALARHKDVNPQLKVLVFNALGQICHSAGQQELAMAMFDQAKQLTGGNFMAEVFDEMVTEQEIFFQPVEATEADPDDLKMIFVGGMPGTGTSLVERILKSHKDVTSIGESTALARTYGAMRMHLAKTDRGADHWKMLSSLTEQEIDIFRQFYMERAFNGVKVRGLTVVDARPLGVFEFALAQKLFPTARFVYLTRNRMDTMLANISTIYAGGNAYGAQPGGLTQLMSFVARSAWDYKTKLGDTMRIQAFETLVKAPESQIPSLLKQLGLEMDEACMAPQPLGNLDEITSSLGKEELSEELVGQWESYKDELAPMAAAMSDTGGTCWRNLRQASIKEI